MTPTAQECWLHKKNLSIQNGSQSLRTILDAHFFVRLNACRASLGGSGRVSRFSVARAKGTEPPALQHKLGSNHRIVQVGKFKWRSVERMGWPSADIYDLNLPRTLAHHLLQQRHKSP